MHAFELYLKKCHIRHVLCRVGHPQTNGKLENLEDFVVWYNDRPHGALNLWEAETPNMAFVRRLWPEVWLGIAAKQFGW
ncbi:MAG: hypothetical protein LBH62_01575 [Nitrososphaerota archaeon]|nr:hypothetical protein [Nitrososphaerota archaeon]